MLDAIIGIASSSGLGAIVGLVGSYLAKREQRKLDEMNNAHEVNMTQLEMQADEAEAQQALAMADKQIEQAEAEAEIASEVAAGQAFTMSQEMGSKNVGTWVDSLRSLMRPLITIYLLVIVTFIAANIHTSLGGLDVLGKKELFSLYTHIINQTVFLTVTAVLWWFGSRSPKSARG